MVQEIAKANGKNIHLTKLLNPFVFILSKFPGKIGGMCNKAFGNMSYDFLNPINSVSINKGILETEVETNE